MQKSTKAAVKQAEFERVEKGITRRGEYSYLVRLMVDGHRLSGTFNSLEEARAYINSKRATLALDGDRSRVLDARVKKEEVKAARLDKMLERYELEVSALKKSADKEAHTIAKMRRSALGQKSLYRITPEDIETYLAGLKREQAGPRQGQPSSPTTKRKHAALLSHLYTIARKRWRMNVGNPVADTELPQPDGPRKRRLEGDEYDRLLVGLGKCRNWRMKPMFILAVETAMRLGELRSLRCEDVRLNGEHGTATLHDTKNGEARVVPLSSRAVAVLAALPRPINGGVIFEIGENAHRIAWEMAKKRAKVEGLRWHDLRHEATSRLFELGLDRIEAASITGHKTLQMLKDYTHLRAENLARKLG